MDAVVQLYVHQRFGSASRLSRELKEFERVRLHAHESQIIEFTLRPEDLSYWSTAQNRGSKRQQFRFLDRWRLPGYVAGNILCRREMTMP